MRILISGGGELGRLVAESLIKSGHTVVIVESRAECCKELAEELNAIVIHGDATRPHILEKGEIADTDVVITTTSSDQDNLITAIVAKEYGVKRIIVKFNDPSFNPVCQRLGINEIVNPKVVAAHQMADMARGFHLLNLSPIVRGDARLFTTIVEKQEHIDRHITDLNLPKDCLIIGVYRHNEFIIPKGNIKLHRGDTITLICNEATLGSLQEIFG